ncbi:hypothetical protein LWI28_015483 [Acer negundo]|uniref:Uncharacterized protein n=1 Tax=Acer negundo TaxID=4023 RepID=A0AAD5IF33_ACENE|nr:hypothetical protein LWI28_015483 [Acer negundo]
MFTTAIPRNLKEAYMCKGSGSNLIGPTLKWECTLEAVGTGVEAYNFLYGPWLKASSPVKSGQFMGRRDDPKARGFRNGGVPYANACPMLNDSVVPLKVSGEDKEKTVDTGSTDVGKNVLNKESGILLRDSRALKEQLRDELGS